MAPTARSSARRCSASGGRGRGALLARADPRQKPEGFGIIVSSNLPPTRAGKASPLRARTGQGRQTPGRTSTAGFVSRSHGLGTNRPAGPESAPCKSRTSSTQVGSGEPTCARCFLAWEIDCIARAHTDLDEAEVGAWPGCRQGGLDCRCTHTPRMQIAPVGKRGPLQAIGSQAPQRRVRCIRVASAATEQLPCGRRVRESGPCRRW